MVVNAGQRLPSLAGLIVLVVEDVYFIADDLCRTLRNAGATIVGPAATTADGLREIAENSIDAAVIDVNLEGEMSYPIAAELTRRGVPFIFASGYDDWAVAAEWQHIVRLQKPYALRDIPIAVAALFDGPKE